VISCGGGGKRREGRVELFRKTAEEGNVELDWKGNKHSMDFKCRSGQVFQGKDLV